MALPVAAAAAMPFVAKLGQAAASQGTTGLIDGLLGQLFGGMNARREWRYQKKAMALQQQYALEQMAKSAEYQLTHDKELFDYQNAYNEPAKVFERYAAAGINPAAVLGSSGVGVSATVPTGSGSAPSASGPTGGASPRGLADVSSNPLAFAQIEMADANTDRARAAANLDNAEADRVRNQTLSKELYEALARSEKALKDAGVNDSNEQARLKGALADIYAAEAVYADVMATYKMQDYIVRYAKDVETYNYIKKYNDEYLDSILTSSILLNFARAYESSAHGGLLDKESEIANVRLADLRNWFDVNWETPIPVREINEKGKPTGKVITMTGKELHSKLLGLAVEHSDQETAANWFKTRSEKNALGYAMLNAVIHGVAGMASSYIGGRAVGKGLTAGTFSNTGSATTTRSIKRYDSKGNLIGYVLDDMTNAHNDAGFSRNNRK